MWSTGAFAQFSSRVQCDVNYFMAPAKLDPDNNKALSETYVFSWLIAKAQASRYRKTSSSIYERGFPRQRVPTGRNVFIFDPKKLEWGAYNAYGRLVKKGRASGGRYYCPDLGRACTTPRGIFRVYRKGNRHCRSSKYPRPRGGARMPHCMFFYGGYAIHGSYQLPNYNASHGCIRVAPKAALWLHQNFIRSGTTVIVRSYGRRR